MKQKKLLSCLLLLVFAACNSGTNKNTNQDTTHDTLTQANNITDAKPGLRYKIDTSKQVNTILVPRDTLLKVDLNNNKGSVRGYLSGMGKHVTVMVPVTGGDSITAQLIADDDPSNIRFTQIYIPVGKTGKFDGPFSRKISYPITVKGNYKLIIGEDLMAENNWQGNFTCNVLIK